MRLKMYVSRTTHYREGGVEVELRPLPLAGALLESPDEILNWQERPKGRLVFLARPADGIVFDQHGAWSLEFTPDPEAGS